MIRMLVCFHVSLLVFAALGSAAPFELPRPSGQFAVGRAFYYWTDNARREVLASADRKREMLVTVWYPAEKAPVGRENARYLPDLSTLTAHVDETILSDLLRPAFDVIRQHGYPRTNSYEGLAIASSRRRYPVLVFSHGLGMVSATYAAEMEDLASHGYVVAAIDHTYDAAFVAFPDDRWIAYAQSTWHVQSRRPRGFLNHVTDRVDVWAADTRFVINQLSAINRDRSPGSPLAGRLDMNRLGAFGHSVGGLATARACQLDQRISACVNQDSDMNGSPFGPIQTPIEQPFMFVVAQTADIFSQRKREPTDDQLVKMKMNREEYESAIQRQRALQDQLLSNVRGGSYRLRLHDLPGFVHRSFSDVTLIATAGANDPVTWRESVGQFRLAQSYLLAFFDKFLNGRPSSLLDDAKTPDSRVHVDRFAASAKPRYVR